MFSSSLSQETCCCLLSLSVMLLLCLSSFSWTTSLWISISCSLSFPKRDVTVIEVRSFDSEMAVTFGCHVLSRHFSTLMSSSSFIKLLTKTHKVIHSVREPLLHITYWFSLLHSEEFILLDQSMLPNSFYIICAFMCDLQDVPHFFGRATLWNPEKLITT